MKKIVQGKAVPSSGGFSHIELLLGVLIISLLSIAVLSALQLSVVTSVKTRVQTSGAHLLQLGFAKLRNMDFFQLFPADSSQPRFGLQAGYPHLATLNLIQAKTSQRGFSKFAIEVTFMRRDSSDANGNSLTSDLIPFTDTNRDGIDDYDPNIRYFDQNRDGDFYDTYPVGNRRVSEMPDTHLKLVTVKLWKGTTHVLQDSHLIGLEGFTGIESPSSESSLPLALDSLPNGANLYDLTAPDRGAAFNLTITRSYPPGTVALQADADVPLRLAGRTEPSAIVRFFVGATTGPAIETTSDLSGSFDVPPSQARQITAALREGRNRLFAQTIKGPLQSPFSVREVILDQTPPTIAPVAPTSPTNTLSPYIAGILVDSSSVTGVEPSGINTEVITFKLDGVVVGHRYDPATRRVVLLSSTTLLPPVLSTGTHTVTLEGGDNARYKVSRTWDFEVAISSVDHSPPAIAQKSPSGTSRSRQPVISVRIFDNQSGMNPQSLVLTLDGVVVVNAANIVRHYDPATDTVQYQPPTPFANGTAHTVTITGSHWATLPPDRVTSTDTWGFTVNAP